MNEEEHRIRFFLISVMFHIIVVGGLCNMSKRITVNEKLLIKISNTINDELCLSRTEILKDYGILPGNAYQDPPDGWTEEENGVADFLSYLEVKIFESIKMLLVDGNAR